MTLGTAICTVIATQPDKPWKDQVYYCLIALLILSVLGAVATPIIMASFSMLNARCTHAHMQHLHKHYTNTTSMLHQHYTKTASSISIANTNKRVPTQKMQGICTNETMLPTMNATEHTRHTIERESMLYPHFRSGVFLITTHKLLPATGQIFFEDESGNNSKHGSTRREEARKLVLLLLWFALRSARVRVCRSLVCDRCECACTIDVLLNEFTQTCTHRFYHAAHAFAHAHARTQACTRTHHRSFQPCSSKQIFLAPTAATTLRWQTTHAHTHMHTRRIQTRTRAHHTAMNALTQAHACTLVHICTQTQTSYRPKPVAFSGK